MIIRNYTHKTDWNCLIGYVATVSVLLVDVIVSIKISFNTSYYIHLQDKSKNANTFSKATSQNYNKILYSDETNIAYIFLNFEKSTYLIMLLLLKVK